MDPVGDHPSFRVRELEPGDGPAIGALLAASPDTGMIRLRLEYRIDPYLAFTFGGHDAGVVAESDRVEGLAGLGMVRFGAAIVRGERRPCASLYSLVVHPACRRQGMARAIAARRLALAAGRLGSDAIAVASIQQGNVGSFANARAWATQLSRPLIATSLSMRRSPPAESSPEPPSARVRPARPEDLAEVAARSNAFHDQFDLWPPATAETLAEWLASSPFAEPVNELWVIEDAGGNLLAGLGTSESRRIASAHVESMPAGLRALNRLMRLVPPGGVLDYVTVSRPWFQAGRERAARTLFEVVRWEMRSQGGVLLWTLDPRGPAARLLPRSPLRLAGKLSLAIRSPVAIRPDRFIAPIG